MADITTASRFHRQGPTYGPYFLGTVRPDAPPHVVECGVTGMLLVGCYDVGQVGPQRINSPSNMKFEIIGELRSIETIATGRAIRVLPMLRKKWGSGRWRKMKGVARVRILRTGHVRDAEIHWYEAHGIGRRDFKIKKLLS